MGAGRGGNMARKIEPGKMFVVAPKRSPEIAKT